VSEQSQKFTTQRWINDDAAPDALTAPQIGTLRVDAAIDRGCLRIV
jgi:hypothetical protein